MTDHILGRRHFLSSAAAVSLAAGVSVLPGQDAAARRMPRVCVYTEHFQSLPLPEVCRLFQQMGVDGLDLTVRPGGHIKPGEVKARLPLAVKAGGLTVHHARTLHGSATNTSGQSRRLLLYQYAAADAWPFGGVGDWDQFNGQILRGEPTYDFRCASLVARTRLPAGSRTGGGIYELQKPLEEKLFAAAG